jgi:hypothetical protein
VRQDAIEELFAMNRGALLQAGISLPVEINLLHGEEFRRGEKTLYRALNQAGFARAGFTHAGREGQARFRLDITFQGSAASCELIDTEGGENPLRRLIPLRSLSKADIYDFARALSNFVFKVE